MSSDPVTPSSKFWDRIAEKYASRPVSDQESYEKKLEITRSYLRPEMKVLEIGCGTGTTALLHAPYVAEILATDISENMIAIARRKAADQGIGNVRFETSAIENLEVLPASYDVVMAHSILHLVANRSQIIGQIFDWLKPGGLLISSTACLDDGMGWLKMVLPPLRWLGRVPYVEFFTARELESEFAAAGFRMERKWLPKRRAAIFMILRK